MDSLIIELEEKVIDEINNTLNVDEIKNNRYDKYEAYVDNVKFDKFMLRLVYEHNNEYLEKCANKGFSSQPNNKLKFIINYLNDRYCTILVRKISTDVLDKVWSYRGYYFQIKCNGGINIYNKDDMTLMIEL